MVNTPIDEFESRAATANWGQTDHHITGLNELTEAIKSYDAKTVFKLPMQADKLTRENGNDSGRSFCDSTH